MLQRSCFILGMLVAGAVFASSAQAASGDRAFSIGAGLSLIASSDQYDYLDDNYDDVEAGGGFIGPQVYINIRASDFFHLLFGVDVLGGFVDVERVDGTDDDYSESLIVPFIAGKLIVSAGDIDVFLKGEVNINEPDTDSDDYDVEDGGVGGGGYFGVTIIDQLDIEGGYRFTPVDITSNDTGDEEEVNYGGAVVRASWRF